MFGQRENSPFNRSAQDLLQDDKDSLAPEPVVLVLQIEQRDEEIANRRGKARQPFLARCRRPGRRGDCRRELTDEVFGSKAGAGLARKVCRLGRKTVDDSIEHRRGRGAEDVVDARRQASVQIPNKSGTGGNRRPRPPDFILGQSDRLLGQEGAKLIAGADLFEAQE